MAFDLGGFLKKRWDTSVIRDAVSSNTAADQQRRQVAAQKAAPVQQPKVPYYGSFSPQVTNTEQAVQQTGRDLGRQQREGQITGQQFNDRFAQLLASTTKDSGYKTPMAQAGNFAKSIVKPFWETGDTVVKGAQLGVANATNNTQAADNARKQRDQSYAESLVRPVSRAAAGINSTFNPAQKSAERQLENKLVELRNNTESFTQNKAKEIQDGIRSGIYDPQKGSEAIQELLSLNEGVNGKLGQFYDEKLATVGLTKDMSAAQSYAQIAGDQLNAAGLLISPASGTAIRQAGGNVVRRGISELGTNSALNGLGGAASAYGQGADLEESLKAGLTQAGVGAVMMGAGYLKGPAAVETNIPAAPGSLRESIQAAKQNVRLAINNPDGANVFKINNPLDAKTTGLDINNPMGAQTKPLDVRNPLGAETGKKLSIVDRYKQATDIDAPKQDGFVRNPLANDAPQVGKTPADIKLKDTLNKLDDNSLRTSLETLKNNGAENSPAYKVGKEILDSRTPQQTASNLVVGSKEWNDYYAKQNAPTVEKPKVTLQEGRANQVLDKKIRYNGQVMTRSEYVDALKNDGYTPTQHTVNGKQTYAMKSPKGDYYDISKIEYTKASTPVAQVGKTDPLESLKQEARKYKSAEEFVGKDNTQFADLPNYKFDVAQANKDFADIASLTEKITTGMPKDATKAQRVKVYKNTIEAVNKKYGTKLSTDINDILETTRVANKYPNELAYEAGRKAKTDLYNQATQSQPPKSPLTVEKNIETAKKQAQAVEKLKQEKKITPKDDGYWTTPVKGQAKDPIPNVKDVNGVQVKEGDVIEVEGLLGGKARRTVQWQEPQIANATGELQAGQWLGNGPLDNGLPFKIVDGKKPTLQDALEGKSTKPFTPLSQPVDNIPAIAKRVAPVESQTRAQLQDGAFKQISGRATPVREKGLLESFQASNAPQDLKDVLGAFSKEERTHLQKSNKKLWNDAQRNVYEDPVSALDYYHKNHNDESVARGYALIERYNKLGDTKAAGELGMDMAERALKAGRETQAYALMKKMTPQGIVAHAERKVAKFIDENPKLASKINFDENVRKDLADRVDKITKMDNGRERNIEIGKMQEVIDNIFPSSIADKAITLWKAGLLTSLRTHERNIIGNAFNGAGELSAQTIGSPIDRLMALRTGKRTTAATLGGYGTGSKEGAVISKDLIKTGVDTTGETLQKYNTHHITWGNGIGGKFAKGYTQSVFRTLGAEDKPFRMGRQANSMHSQALAEASNLGLRGAEKRAFVNKFTKEVNDAARQEGKISTFAEDTAIGDAITKGKSALKERNQAAGAVAEAVVPFSQVPASVATQLLRYSPAGLAKGIYDVGKVLVTGNPELQRKAALAFGRGATGTAIMGAGALLMSKGLMTGDYPTDPREKAQWELERKQPNSIMVGGKWKSINSVGPQTVLALAGGKVEDELSKGKGTLVEKKDAAINSFGYIGKQFSDQTFVKGLTNFTDAFTNPNRKFESYVEGQVTSVIPNIVKDVAKGTDSTVREISSLSDKIKTSIPGLSGNLTPQRDVFGNEIKREGGIIGATTDLFNSKTPQSTTTIRELDRIAKEGFSATPARTDKNVTIGGEDIKLEPKHIGMIEAVVGPIQKKAMVDIMNSPNYSKYNDQEKSDVLKDVNAVVEPVESLRVARDNKLIDQATFEKAVGNLNKSQIEYLKTGTIPVAPVIRKDKETNQAVASLFDKNNNNSATTGVQFTPAGKTKAQSEFDVASSNRDLTMTRAKANNDLNAWNTAAAEEYDAIGQQIKALDPKTDQVKINTLIKKQEALQRTALGYKANGYIKKTTKATGKGSKGGKFTIPTSSVASSARTSTFTNLNRLLAGTTKTNSNKGKIGNKVALRKITVKGVKS